MAKAKKFGVFGGVFTPSILTILGVIMYLRLGWVVGNAGLIGSLAIVLVAHIISISTGLSVSSVATDRKVKAGGLYYMLSRSLGLPIGGSIGIALFAATALSISMYIVGFSESFNEAIGWITPGMSPDDKKYTLQITGSITLFIITGIALISTSLAIKAQYYILAAIGLSLISIFAGGFFIEPDLIATNIEFFATEGSAGYEEVFGIFFPAVTGFTAGVAMSGDLEDPKKSIPVGTMAAIIVGLFVYIILTVFLAVRIDGDALRNTEINLFSRITLLADYGAPFLMAGIWGATLSSALGGILGGPRILQAMSADQVTPKIFAKGVGATNEPRNALIFTFVIAEVGVVIAELDLIAPIVSMFYLTAYGFINLTSALESWTGSDFRPQFRIPRAVSIIGAVATFTVMSQIGLLPMFMAFLIIGAIFFYLTKQQINLGFSDIWQGVWAELVRIGLFRLDRKSTANDKKNWRPNILLFSGDQTKRLHLVEFGKGLVGRLGVVSSFEVVEQSNKQEFLPKAQQSQPVDQSVPGMFFRKYYAEEIYDGIGIIAETFGFSGMEPNTVLMGWARYSRSPQEFTRLIKRFHRLDYNLLIMDYDQEKGFGEYQTVDIWWNGESNHVSFALTMARFLTSGEDWRKSNVRLFIMLDKTRINSMEVYQQMEDALEELRIYANVKIVDNQKDQKPLYDAIRVESARADLILVELPDPKNQEESFFSDTDSLCRDLGTVVLYQGSTQFDPIRIGFSDVSLQVDHNDDPKYTAGKDGGKYSLVLPQHNSLANTVRQLDSSLKRVISEYHQEAIKPITQEQSLLLASLQEVCLKTLDSWMAEENPTEENAQLLLRQAIEQAQSLFQAHAQAKLKVQSDQLYNSKKEAFRQIRQVIRLLPRTLPQQFSLEQQHKLSEEQLNGFSTIQRTWSKWAKKPAIYNHAVRSHVETLLLTQGIDYLRDWRESFLSYSFEWGQQLHLIEQYVIRLLQENIQPKNLRLKEDIENSKQSIKTSIKALDGWVKKHESSQERYWRVGSNRLLQQLSFDLDNLKRRKSIGWGIQKVVNTEDREAYWGIAATWADNQRLLFNRLLLDAKLSLVQQFTKKQSQYSKNHINHALQDFVLFDLKRLGLEFENYLNGDLKGLPKARPPRTEWYFQHQQAINELISSVNESLGQLPDEISLPSEKAMMGSADNPVLDEDGEIPMATIAPQAVGGYLIQTSFIEPLVEETEKLSSLIEEAIVTLQSSARVIGISIKNTGEKELTESEEAKSDFRDLVQEELGRVSEAQEKLQKGNESLILLIDKLLGDISEKLDAYGLVKSASQFDTFLKTKSREEVLNRFAQVGQSISHIFNQYITDWRYYGWRKAFTQQTYSPPILNQYADSEELTPFLSAIKPKRNIQDQLPFYYRQLFSSEQHISMELWSGREKELAVAAQAVERHLQGLGGSMLITGGYLSGKTLLAEKITDELLQHKRVLHVRPPESGTADLKVFRKAFNQAMGDYNYRLDTIMERILPEGSVVILHDLELWWDRKAEGYQVIDRIEDLLANYSRKILFIAIVNHHTVAFWQKNKRLESCFTNTIRCAPFNAKGLRTIIQARHRSTHLRYQFKDIHEDELSNWQEAGIFTGIYRCSQGNVGVALQAWKAAITGVERHLLNINKPVEPDYEVLERLSPDWLLVLIQFVLHKHLTVERLSGILQIDLYYTGKKISTLHRAGLLDEQNGIWHINKYVNPYLIRFLEEREVL